jgi:hypothetical protein
MEPEKKIGIPFRDFVNKSTNLITVFGIFNALFIFSTTFEKTMAYQFLGIAFFALSVYVWIEIILMAIDCSDTSWRYELFSMFAISITIGLFVLFYHLFKLQIILLTAAAVFFILFFILTHYTIKLSIKRLAKVKETRRKSVIFLIMLASMFLTVIILKIGKPLIKPVFNKWLDSAVQDSTGQRINDHSTSQ